MKLVECPNQSVSLRLWGEPAGHSGVEVSNTLYKVRDSLKISRHFGETEILILEGKYKGRRLCAGDAKLSATFRLVRIPKTVGSDCIVKSLYISSQTELQFRSDHPLQLSTIRRCERDCKKLQATKGPTILKLNKSRTRRSTWAYWLHGGPFTSINADQENTKILDLMHQKDALLRNELDKRFWNVQLVLEKENEGLALIQEIPFRYFY